MPGIHFPQRVVHQAHPERAQLAFSGRNWYNLSCMQGKKSRDLSNFNREAMASQAMATGGSLPLWSASLRHGGGIDATDA